MACWYSLESTNWCDSTSLVMYNQCNIFEMAEPFGSPLHTCWMASPNTEYLVCALASLAGDTSLKTETAMVCTLRLGTSGALQHSYQPPLLMYYLLSALLFL